MILNFWIQDFVLILYIDGILQDSNIPFKVLFKKNIYVQHFSRISYYIEFIFIYCIGNYKYSMYFHVVSIFKLMMIEVVVVSLFLLFIFRMIWGMPSILLLHLFYFVALLLLGERETLIGNFFPLKSTMNFWMCFLYNFHFLL